MASRPLAVLLVDDHRVFAESLGRALLATDGIGEIHTASSVQEAERLIRTTALDIAVIDFRLAGDDALDVLDAISRWKPSLPALLLTAVLKRETVRACFEAGCSGYLTKSAPLEQVEEAIAKVAAGGNYVPDEVLQYVLPGRGAARSAATLTPREREVLAILGDGLSNSEMAERLVVSDNTIRNHLQRIMKKLDAHSKLEVVVIARREGLIVSES